MTLIHHQIDTKAFIADKMLVRVQRSTEDSAVIDVFHLGELIAYVEYGDDWMNVVELDTSISTEVVEEIKIKSEILLTEEMKEAERQTSYNNYYAAKNSETINA